MTLFEALEKWRQSKDWTPPMLRGGFMYLYWTKEDRLTFLNDCGINTATYTKESEK